MNIDKGKDLVNIDCTLELDNQSCSIEISIRSLILFLSIAVRSTDGVSLYFLGWGYIHHYYGCLDKDIL